MANKVCFGIKNLHYAIITEAADGKYTYATPVAIPGAVSLSLDIAGDASPFYADNVLYYQSVANNGYTGSFEAAGLPDAFYEDVLGETEDTSKVFVEALDVEPKRIALLFQIEGDVKASKYVFYNVQVKRPGISTSTIAESKEPNTLTVDFTAMGSTDPDHLGEVKARTKGDTTSTVDAGWFTAVYR